VTITVTYVNDPPGIVEITKPSDGIEITEGDKIDLTGSCDDPDLLYGDELTYKWKSNISGELGSGNELQHITLLTGHNLITLEVWDKAGEKAIDTIAVIVKAEAKPVEGSDDDGDGMPDAWEIQFGLDPLDPLDALEDKDDDGLSNLAEYQHGTNPNKADTDDDGLNDGDEINTMGTNASNPDTDGDSYYDNVDKYPLDSTKWDDDNGPATKPDEKETNWGLIGGIIVVIIIVAIVLFFLFIKPRMGARNSPEETPNENLPSPEESEQKNYGNYNNPQ
jgi:hypothetical protein